MADAHPVVVEVVRSGFVEGVHRGSAVVVDAHGAVRAAVGDVGTPVFPRSCNKPMQAVGMVRAGLTVSGADLAMAAASHSGSRSHVERVERLLAGAGLDPLALRCPPDLPYGERELHEWLRAGRDRAPVAMTCSGKHAAMLLTCLANGWSLADYPSPGHPLQRHLLSTVEDLAGERVEHVGVDGCGAPVFALTLTGLARGFLRVVGADGGPERAVGDAMRAHPEVVAGAGRIDAVLMRAVPGLLAKEGAEAVYAVAVPGVGAAAVKIDDGAVRAVAPVVASALRHLGVGHPDVEGLASSALHGGGRPVGEVRVVIDWGLL